MPYPPPTKKRAILILTVLASALLLLAGSACSSDDAKLAGGKPVAQTSPLTGFWPNVEMAAAWIHVSNDPRGVIKASAEFASSQIGQYDVLVNINNELWTNEKVQGDIHLLTGPVVKKRHSLVNVEATLVGGMGGVVLTCGKTDEASHQSTFACMTTNDYLRKKDNWDQVQRQPVATRIASSRYDQIIR